MNHLAVILLITSNVLGHHLPSYDTSYFVSKRDIAFGSPLILGDSDDLYYFTVPCSGSELTMTYAGDNFAWNSVDLPFANKTLPAFVVYVEKIRKDNETFAIYAMIMAVNGQLFEYVTDPPSWKPFNKFGTTNRPTFQGSATFQGIADGIWHSPVNPKTLYTSLGIWDFSSTEDNFEGLTGRYKDIELFPIIDMEKANTKYEKWVLLLLTECGYISYYVGDMIDSKFNTTSSEPSEFMQAENVNDLGVTDQNPLTVLFNTYLRRSGQCDEGEWSVVIPLLKTIKLYQIPKREIYRLFTRFSFDPNSLSNKFVKKMNVDVSSGNVLDKYESNNFYIESLFGITPTTTEFGVIARRNPETKDGVTVGVSLVGKFYFYDKGSEYGTPVEQEYCAKGDCPVKKNITMTYVVSSKELRFALFVDGPLIEAYYFGNFFFSFLNFRPASHNKIAVYSKGESKASVTLHIYEPDLKRK